MAPQIFHYKLPVSNRVVKFREVTFGDRKRAIDLVQQLGRQNDLDLRVSDLLASYALVSVGDLSSEDDAWDPDVTTRFDSWHYKDVTAYVQYFSVLCLVTDEEIEEITRTAKKHLKSYMNGEAIVLDEPLSSANDLKPSSKVKVGTSRGRSTTTKDELK